MEFRPVAPGDYEPVRQFLSEVGWGHRVGDAEKFRKMMENTGRAVVAFEGGRVVGFARALCDEVSNGYISMVAVAADRRGRGIGANSCGGSSGTTEGLRGSCARGAGAAASGRRWVSSRQKLRWRGSGFEARRPAARVGVQRS